MAIGNTPEYNRAYYLKNKEKMIKQNHEANLKAVVRKVIRKLNDGKYTRVPYSKIEKYGLKLDSNNKYYQEKEA